MRHLLPVLLLAACSSQPDASGLTADDQRQLNEAAEMLDANSMDLNQVDSSANESPAP